MKYLIIYPYKYHRQLSLNGGLNEVGYQVPNAHIALFHQRTKIARINCKSGNDAQEPNDGKNGAHTRRRNIAHSQSKE